MAFDIDGLTNQTIKDLPGNPIITCDPSDPACTGTSGTTSSGKIIGLNPNATSDPRIFVINGIIIFLWIMGIVTALTFIFAGLKYITAGGDSEKAESAKKIITGSIVGMLIILASFVVFRFGVNALNNPTPARTQAEVQQLMNQK